MGKETTKQDKLVDAANLAVGKLAVELKKVNEVNAFTDKLRAEKGEFLIELVNVLVVARLSVMLKKEIGNEAESVHLSQELALTVLMRCVEHYEGDAKKAVETVRELIADSTALEDILYEKEGAEK